MNSTNWAAEKRAYKHFNQVQKEILFDFMATKTLYPSQTDILELQTRVNLRCQILDPLITEKKIKNWFSHTRSEIKTQGLSHRDAIFFLGREKVTNLQTVLRKSEIFTHGNVVCMVCSMYRIYYI